MGALEKMTEKTMRYDVVVIGGGMSGMTAAIRAASGMRSRGKTPHILLLEKNKKLGKKLYATGNGKCNLANRNLDLSCYESENEFFPYKIMTVNSCNEVEAFFRQLGVMLRDDHGYLYPMSMQASSIVWALSDRIRAEKIELHLSEKAESVKIQDGLYRVYTDQGSYETVNLILACGGAAAPKLGGSLSGYRLAESLGHTVIEPLPGLCKLKTKEDCELLNGVRTGAEAALYIGDKLYMTERGELQFTAEGLSGIMIFNLSVPAAVYLKQNENVSVVVDFLPDLTEHAIISYLESFQSDNPDRTVLACLNGLLHEKISQYILKRMNISGKYTGELDKHTFYEIAKRMKRCIFPVVSSGSFEEAQVACKGIDTMQINPDTMESRIQPNLFLTGEMLDVTGKCGGYNLMWAVITGIKAGNGIHI